MNSTFFHFRWVLLALGFTLGYVGVQAQSGEVLAKKFCASCHRFPEPSELDTQTWRENVLPEMGMRLGIKEMGRNPYQDLDSIDLAVLKALHVYPDTPALDKDSWDKIVNYYLEESPSQLTIPQRGEPQAGQAAPFSASFITIGEDKLPQVSLLRFDPGGQQLYVGNHQNLYALASSGQVVGGWQLPSPPVHIDWLPQKPPLVLTIGHFRPSDRSLGNLSYLTQPQQGPPVYLQGLKRPVSFAIADLDVDGQEDVVVCHFGNFGGKLSWYKSFDPKEEKLLDRLPGARKVVIQDMDNDGLLDVVALLAQAWEQVAIYYNQGNGQFKKEVVLQFSPTQGSSYFEMADFNRDGHQDILLTNGDNWDFSRIPKPYHGLRIFLNQGDDTFAESYFYPMVGCSKAMARDFDQDGDLDIVASSFYNDSVDYRDAFVYLENTGQLQFRPHYVPEAVYGKWLTMDVADFDQDGLLDVALGSFLYNMQEMSSLVAASGVVDFPQVLLLTQLQKK